MPEVGQAALWCHSCTLQRPETLLDPPESISSAMKTAPLICLGIAAALLLQPLWDRRAADWHSCPVKCPEFA